MRLRSSQLALLFPVLVLLASAAVVDGVGVGGGTHAADAQTMTLQRGRAFEQPRVLRSHRGRLRTTFRVEEHPVTVAGRQVRGKSYDGEFIGPTLRVLPGDTLEIRLMNHLAEMTNLHLHGFHVSPAGISDNVLRPMPSGSDNLVRVRLPRSLSPGTYWYHAHMHGLVEEQISSGLAGVIVVDGLRQRLPRALRRVPERVIALKDLQVRNGRIATKIIESVPIIRTVNGLVDPVLQVRTNQAQLLRLANISADGWYRLRLDGTSFTVIAEDGQPAGRVWADDELILPPGKRYDALVRWRQPGTYRLRTLRYRSGPSGDAFPERRLATAHVSGTPAPDVAWPRSLGSRPRLERAPITRVRYLTFSENNAKGRFFINRRTFDPGRVDEVVQLGSTEEWVLRNVTREQHPFHLHVNAFQVISVNGRRYPARGLQDTVILPGKGVVRIRMRFADFVGTTVYHCHIAEHEDGGMMGVLEITRTGRRPQGAGTTRRHSHGVGP